MNATRCWQFFILAAGLALSGAVPAASGNADLETLTVRATGGAKLEPAFAPDRTQYEVRLPSDIRALHLRGSAWVGASKLRINDQPVASLAWQRVELKPGANRIALSVVAPDGVASRTYVIDAHREDVRPVAAKFLKLVHADTATGVPMPYRLFVPEGYDRSRKYPLVLFLHGGGQGGTDNEGQLTSSEGATIWAKPGEQAKRPAFVLAPQSRPYVTADTTLPLGGFGITRDREGNRHMAEALTPSADIQSVVRILEHVMREYAIDGKRVYATGLSQGGFGTWNLGVLRPDLFAALVPVAGGTDPELAPRIATMPVWAFHSEDDQVVAVKYSRDTIAALRRAGGYPIYTEIPSGTFFDPNEHWSWVHAYRSESMREWLFRQAKP